MDQLQSARLARANSAWPTFRLRHIARLTGGGTPSKDQEAFWTGGTVPWVSPKDMKARIITETEDYITEAAIAASATSYIEAGSPLVVVRSGILRHTLPVALAGCKLTLNQDMKAFRLSDRLDSSFFAYWIEGQSDDLLLEWRQFGATVESIDTRRMLDGRIAVPDRDTQKAIAAFLDRETGRIDELIAKKERFISLIDEKRAALIEKAINGTLLHGPTQIGLSSWFGSAPGHWRVRRARYLFRERLELSDQGTEELLTVSHITGVTARSEKDVNMFLAETLEGYKLVRSGDLVVNTMWAWMGAMGVSPIAGCASPSYAVYRQLNNSFNDQYLDLLVRALSFVAEVNRRSKGIWASRLRLYPDAFLDILLPVPPLDEQRAILRALNTAIGREDEIAKLSRKSIEQLKSRRASLIIAAVTGQVDVRQQPIIVTTKVDRSRFRIIVGAEIVQRHQGNAKFGRVKLQKELYLAEAHAGIKELQGTYFREAAGPLDRTLVEETERGMEASAFSRATLPEIHAKNGGVAYSPLPKAGQHCTELEALLGARAKTLRHLIELMRDFDTRSVEAIATLYAVWNDALIDGETPDDDAIVCSVLNDWHPEKRNKFKDADLRHWLAWMKRNGLVPSGTGPRTISTAPRDMFG
jgi:type I restriction enzyme, S subunit